MPFIPRIRILDSVTNTNANLGMKDYVHVKYLGLMIDSNISWKFHIESICHKISKSIGIIAKIRHYVLRHVLLSEYNSFFLKSNCLPLPSLFFRDCSYLLYDINRQTAPVSILNQFVKTNQIHNYRNRSVSSD